MRGGVSWRLGRVIAALIAVAGTVPAAKAQQEVPNNLAVIGKFYNPEGTRVLFVVTSKSVDGKPKAAGVGVEQYNFNGTYNRLVAVFVTDEEWRKFVELWKKARSGQDSKNDTYFDGETMILVSPNHDGSVGFAFANRDENKQAKDLTIFDLPTKDFPQFDREVKQVSAYFAK